MSGLMSSLPTRNGAPSKPLLQFKICRTIVWTEDVEK